MAQYEVTLTFQYKTVVEAYDEDNAIEAAEEETKDSVQDYGLVQVEAEAFELEDDDETFEDDSDVELPENSGVFPLDEEAQELIDSIKPE